MTPGKSQIDRLLEADRAFRAAYPGDSAERQPVHTVYGGAHLFRFDLARRLGDAALRALETYAPDADAFARALRLDDPRVDEQALYERVVRKLEHEPVEDFRIDFEDGYGHRPDDEEDAAAEHAASEVARGLDAGALPPFIGIRIKPLDGRLAARGLKTLERFLTTLGTATSGALPPGFVVTLPKVVDTGQVESLGSVFETIENEVGFARGSLRMELMVETPQSIFARDGGLALPALVAAGGGRVISAHFGVYDYTASMGITADHQELDHPACDFARHTMQVALAGTGVMLSDGATNVLPVGPHRAGPDGSLSEADARENAAVVHRAWQLHARHVRHSLRHAYYQGWDLHPAQLPTRYATVYAFFRSNLEEATHRLRRFLGQAAQATLSGDIFDDAATAQGLLTYFLRAAACGAISESEMLATGLTLEQMRGRSFADVLATGAPTGD